MRQHVNPLSKNFLEVEPIPPLNIIFTNPKSPLHLDIGCASGDFLIELASQNKNWNYLGIEIREKLVLNATLKMKNRDINNLHFMFGNANNILNNLNHRFLLDITNSISFNFPDPWFKKKHHKRRVIQQDLINFLSISLKVGSLIFIKTDVKELFDYMEFMIKNCGKFEKINISNFKYAESYNPLKNLTNREKYVLLNSLQIYESIFMKI